MTDRGHVKEFAQSLAALKQRSGSSFDALARRLGTSGSTLHRYCSGAAVPGDFQLVEKLARLCGAESAHLKELHRLWILADAVRNAPETAAESEVTAPPEPVRVPRWRSLVTPKKAVSAVVLIGALGSGAVVLKPLILSPADEPKHPVAASQPATCVHNRFTTHVDGFHDGRVWESDFLCPTIPGATLVAMTDFRTPIAVLDSANSWLLCWEARRDSDGKEEIWYYTRGDRMTRGEEPWDGWGFLAADQVQSPQHPVPDMPRC